MKRLAFAVAFALLLWWLYPLEGIWWPGQMVRASVDGQPVPQERIAELYWELQASRWAGEFSKCLGWVELELRDGSHKQMRLSQAVALEKWTNECP